jgi:hypothetical protein
MLIGIMNEEKKEAHAGPPSLYYILFISHVPYQILVERLYPRDQIN